MTPELYEEFSYWNKEAEIAGRELLDYFEETKSKIINISSRKPWFLHFNPRLVTEKGYYILELGLQWVNRRGPSFQEMDQTLCFIREEFSSHVSEIRKRFVRTKFYTFFRQSLFLTSNDSPSFEEERMVPKREWEGNFKGSLKEKIQRIFTVRLEKTDRVKPKVFRRGYDDHGTCPSKTEKARRSANTLFVPVFSEGFLDFLRGLDDPLSELRRQGFLLPEDDSS
jgi:hypothetical protein